MICILIQKEFVEMFVVEDETAGPPLSSPDNPVMHAFGIMPEVNYRLMLHETRFATDSPFPRISQAQDDSESVRRKLCDSLTSALEMVVSNQLVKNVLGVVNDLETVEVRDVRRHVQPKAHEGVSRDRIIENEARVPHEMSECSDSLSMDLDLKDNFRDERKPKTDGKHNCFASLPIADKSPEPLLLKLNCEEKQGFFVPQETMGGLELMEQAKRVARNVELNLFYFNGGVNKKYKEKARSLLFNLKDRSNPELRASVFDGKITPKILVRMSAEQLASKELSQWRTAKAEKLASMVVLTDADLDPHRTVKKSHKVEFQVLAEEIDFSATTRSASRRPVISAIVEEDVGETKRGDPTSGRVGSCGSKLKVLSDSCSKEDRILQQIKLLSRLQERVENKTSAKEETANLVRKYPGTMDARNGIVSEISEQPSKEDGTLDALDLTHTALDSRGKMLRMLPVNSPDYCTNKLSKTNNRCTDSGGVGSSLSERSRRGCEAAVWEGSIQLSATRFALINGFYESGERLELKDWPRSVEVKGRVRLVVLDKFLQDLQLSRSRTVTILSLCPSECHSDANQSTAYLKEMADHYRIGGRAGFVEPRPGFELYLLAPNSMSLEPSCAKELLSLKATTKREDGVLRGVVVWRKSQPQGLPFSRGPDQNVSVKEVAFSNLVLQTNTKIDVKPSHCIETPTSEGWFPAFQTIASAPSLIYVSGNSSMGATNSRGDASSEQCLPIDRDWHPPSPTAIDHRTPTSASPSDKISQNAHGTAAKPVSRLHQSVELQDIPPGFLPRPVQTCQARSEALPAPSKNVVLVCRSGLPYPSRVTGQAPLLPYQRKEISKDPPPGFLHEPLVDVPEGTHTAAVKDDDDLPEFNFDVEGVVSQAGSNPLLPANSSLFLSRYCHNAASQSFAGLHVMSDASIRYHGHRHSLYDLHPLHLEVDPVPGGHPPRHRSHYEESCAWSATSVPTAEGWPGAERRADTVPDIVRDFSIGVSLSRGNHQRNPQMRTPQLNLVNGEDSTSVTPMNEIDQRSSQVGAPFKRTFDGEKESCIIGHENQRILAPSVPESVGLPSSQLQFPSQGKGKVAEHFLPRIDIPQQQTRYFLSRAGLPSLPPVPAGHPLYSRHQLSLVHMVVQHQHSMMNGAVNLRPMDAPLPQEPWNDYWQDVGTCNPSKRQQLGSRGMHNKYDNLHRKSAKRETYITEEDASVKLAKSGREERGIRDGNQKCGRSSNILRDQKKRGNMTHTPEAAKEVRGKPEPVMESTVPKSLKRGRERERDQ